MSFHYQPIAGGRKRRRLNTNQDHNHNRRNDVEEKENNNNNNSRNTNIIHDLQSVPPAVIQPKTEADEPKLTQALSILNTKLDIFEREQLEKKKLEMYEVTKQKILALTDCMNTQFINNPHMIGCIPGISGSDQEKVALHCWINKYKENINKDVAIRSIGMNVFIEQITTLETDVFAWHNFFTKWRLNRILYTDNFENIWTKIKSDLNIMCDEYNDCEDDDLKMEELDDNDKCEAD